MGEHASLLAANAKHNKRPTAALHLHHVISQEIKSSRILKAKTEQNKNILIKGIKTIFIYIVYCDVRKIFVLGKKQKTQ